MAYDAKDIIVLRNKTSAGMALCKEALDHADGDMEKAIAYINEKSDVIGRLHDLTGAKIGLSKLAFKDAGGDFEKAVALIKERGWETDSLDVDSKNAEGLIGSYIHGTDRKMAALVEVHCLTDFVANNEEFIQFANELAKQAAAMKPTYVDIQSIPEEKIEELKALFKREVEEEGKPEKMHEKIIEGKLSKYYGENCLLEQKWFKDESKTMQNLVDEAVQKFGESISVVRMVVWSMK